jgi:mannose-6-phosphate isomerase-like protein (cupin superfamily)
MIEFMKPTKYTFSQTNRIDLGTKVIYKYPTPTMEFDIGHMVVNGRHPQEPHKFALETKCSFVMYIIKGTGTVYVNDETLEVVAQDVVFVPAKTKFAVEGIFEYITFDAPAFFPEQSEEVDG